MGSEGQTTLRTSVMDESNLNEDSITRIIDEGMASRTRRGTVFNPNPPLQRENCIPVGQNMSIDDGYDSETMQKFS